MIRIEYALVFYSIPGVSTPKGKGNLTAYVDEFVEREVTNLADESGLCRSKYLTALLVDAIQRKRVFRFKKGQFIEENVQNQHSKVA